MLKIKDNVDLKQLEKYGFEVTDNFAKKVWYWSILEGVSVEYDTWLVVEYRELWLIEQGANRVMKDGLVIHNLIQFMT